MYMSTIGSVNRGWNAQGKIIENIAVGINDNDLMPRIAVLHRGRDAGDALGTVWRGEGF